MNAGSHSGPGGPAPTYHDDLKEPREILMSIPGVTFKEMAAPDTCCGSGGSFVLTHYDTSASLGRNKVQDIGQTGAGTVATGCPACMMQLLDSLGRSGQHQSVTHYISLLAESYRREREARQPGGAPSLRPARS